MAIKGTLKSPKTLHHWNITIRLFRVISRTLDGGPYSSAEAKSVYSIAPADWVKLSKVFRPKEFSLEQVYWMSKGLIWTRLIFHWLSLYVFLLGVQYIAFFQYAPTICVFTLIYRWKLVNSLLWILMHISTLLKSCFFIPTLRSSALDHFLLVIFKNFSIFLTTRKRSIIWN